MDGCNLYLCSRKYKNDSYDDTNYSMELRDSRSRNNVTNKTHPCG